MSIAAKRLLREAFDHLPDDATVEDAMTARPAPIPGPLRVPVFALRLLGGLSLQAPDGSRLTGRAAHRHRLALLARLAVAAPARVSRETLSALLWPERDDASARRLLRVALHEMRQILGPEALPAVSTEVGLDLARLPADVHRFEALLARGDLAGAMAQYRGPFLHGFTLEGADGFNAWASAERTRLAALHAEAVAALARSVAEREGGASAATGAEVGSTPGAGPTGAEIGAHLVIGAMGTAGTPRAARPARSRGRRRALAGMAAVAALAGAAAVAGTARAWAGDPMSRPGEADPTAIAVAPFQVVGALPVDLGPGLAALLSANLDQVAELRLVPAAVVAARLAATDSGGDASWRASPLAHDPRALLAALRAESLVEGTVTPAAGGTIVATARLIDRDGTVRARARVQGEAADLAGLVDGLSLALIRELLGRRWGVPQPRFADIGTASAPALRAYLRGEGYLRRAQWDSAAGALATAVDLDSTFALAYLRLAEPYGWRYGMASAPAQQALAAATRLADRLPPRERMLLAVRRLHEAGDLRALDSAAELANRYGGEAEAQYVHADVRFHAREALGMDMILRSRASFDTVIAMDSGSARAYPHPLSLALQLGDTARFDHITRRLQAMGEGGTAPDGKQADYALLRRVRFARDGAEALAVFSERLRNSPPRWEELDELLVALERHALAGPRAQPELILAGYEAARRTYGVDAQRRSQLDGRRSSVLVGLGRLEAARQWLGPTWDADPRRAPAVVMLPASFGFAPPGWLEEPARRLARSAYWNDGPARQRMAAWWRAMFALQEADTGTAREALARAGARPAPGNPADTLTRGARGALRAGHGLLRLIEGDTVAALREMDAGLREVGYEGEGLFLTIPVRIRRLRLLSRMPARVDEAIDLIRGDMVRGGGHRQAWWYLLLADALELRGDARAAAEARARFRLLWAGADPAARAAAEAALAPAPSVAGEPGRR